MTKKKILGVVAAVLVAVASALGAGVSFRPGEPAPAAAPRSDGEIAERVRALEVRNEEYGKWLHRIEGKLDKVLERR